MALGKSAAVLRHIDKLVAEQKIHQASDRQLLRRFTSAGDEAAFAAIVQRHGAMVLRVCRHLLADPHDAEDAFQATFLVLLRRASMWRWRASVAGWLHEVACRVARQVRKQQLRRRVHEARAAARVSEDAGDDVSLHEAQMILHEELHRLPERLRAPLVLCYLESAAQDEAAARLGWSLRTLKRRLERGRALLHARLTRRGLTLSAVLSTGLLPDAAASATLTRTTLASAVSFLAGRAALSPGVSAAVGATLRSMIMAKLRVTGFMVFIVMLGTGLTFTGSRAHTNALPSQEPEANKTRARSVRAGPPEQSTAPALQTDMYGDPLPDGALARIGTSRLRTMGGVNVVAFSHDGHRLAYGTENGRIHVCEAVDGKQLFELRPDETRIQSVTELAFSPDDRTLAAGGFWSPVVWLIDIATYKIRHTLPNTVESQGKWSRRWQGPGFAFTPDGRTLVVGGKDGRVQLWDPMTARQQAVLAAENEPIMSLTLTADGQTALSAHRGGQVHLWDVGDRKHVRKLSAIAKHPHLSALSPDGKTIALATAATELGLWDPDGVQRHQLRTQTPIAGLGFTADGRLLQVADSDGNVTAWHVQTAKKQRSWACKGISRRWDPYGGPKPWAWFRPDGKWMAWTVETVRLWDLTTGIETPSVHVYPQGITWAGFATDGRLLRVLGHGGELGLWDSATGRPSTPPLPRDLNTTIRHAPPSSRGQILAVTGESDVETEAKSTTKGRILIWDPTTGTDLIPIRNQARPAWYAALSPDRRLLVATEAGGTIQVYDTGTAKPIRSFEGRKYEYRPTFSPDGAVLATTASAWTIRLYHFASGRVLRELKASSPARCLAFSPDGRWLASGHMTQPRPAQSEPGDMIYLWDTASGRKLRRIPTGHYAVEGVAFSADGRLIASCGYDFVVRLWEAASGQERRRYEGHRSWVQSVDFAPDGRRLVSASLDGTAVVWRLFDPAPAERSAAELAAVWADLGKDGKLAHQAVSGFIAAKGTVSFLKTRLKPAVMPVKEQLHNWLADLGSSAFKTRASAQKELGRVCEQIEPELRRALAAATDGEVRRRLATLLDAIPRPETRPEQLRELRAVEALGHINSDEARRLLAALATGAAEATVTLQARAALKRRTSR